MIDKTFINADGKAIARVTFSIPENIWADRIHLVGDFNQWDHSSHPMQRNHTGSWSLTLDLELDRAYRFRYLLDRQHWLSDLHTDPDEAGVADVNSFLVKTNPNHQQML